MSTSQIDRAGGLVVADTGGGRRSAGRCRDVVRDPQSCPRDGAGVVPIPAKQLGLRQTAIGVVLVAITAAGVLW